jgi:exosortase
MANPMATSIEAAKPAPANAGTAESKPYYGWMQMASIALLVGFLYWQVVADMAANWWNEESASHGLLIPPLALYLAWMRRRSISSEPAAPAAKGLWVTGFGCLVYLTGRLGAEFFLTRISLVIILAGLIWTFWGGVRLKKLGFPVLLLATMVPLPVLVWNALATPLQLFASDIATTLAQWLGVAVYRDGNIIHLADISLGVAEACSGLHSLSALMIGALLVGYLQLSSFGMRAVLFLLSLPLAIALNVARITGTAVLADYWRDIAFGFYHYFSGWLVFVAGFAVMWLAAMALHRLEKRS